MAGLGGGVVTEMMAGSGPGRMNTSLGPIEEPIWLCPGVSSFWWIMETGVRHIKRYNMRVTSLLLPVCRRIGSRC